MPRGTGQLLRAPSLALMCTALLLLSACSSSGGSSVSLGLTGSTASHADEPPALAANGPADVYAFVYDNQIWLHDAGKPTAQQLTHLVLSAGAAISWGPLAWSPNGKFIAFALSENNNPSAASSTTAPVYVASTVDGSVVNTAVTGSLYGHTYAWFGSQMLFFSTNAGIMMYDLGDVDPRVWSVLDPYNFQSGGPNGNTADNSGVTYADIALTSNYLYYSKISLDTGASLGAVGVNGTAELHSIFLNGLQPDADYQPGDIVSKLPLTGFPNLVRRLGNVYFDKSGNLVSGTWQISRDGSQVILQQIDAVNAKSGAVSSSFCQGSLDAGFDCSVLKGAGSYTLANRPNTGIDNQGAHVAYTDGTLYTQTNGSGTVAKLDNVGWTTPPTWSNDGKRVAVTQFVSSTTDANGVPQEKLNIVIYDGNTAVTLVTGGQDLAWKP